MWRNVSAQTPLPHRCGLHGAGDGLCLPHLPEVLPRQLGGKALPLQVLGAPGEPAGELGLQPTLPCPGLTSSKLGAMATGHLPPVFDLSSQTHPPNREDLPTAGGAGPLLLLFWGREVLRARLWVPELQPRKAERSTESHSTPSAVSAGLGKQLLAGSAPGREAPASSAPSVSRNTRRPRTPALPPGP